MAGCSEDWFESLSAWHDGEVSREDARRVEAHLSVCPVCRRELEALITISESLREASPVEVPARVRSAAEASVDHGRVRRWWWLAAAAALPLLVGAMYLRRGLPPAVAEEVVARHLGGFARAQPCDVESSDLERVSAWLAERVGYRVNVPVAERAQLIGGRLCHLCGERAAALMLRLGDTPLTVFVPPPGSDAAREATRLATQGDGCTSGPLKSWICARSTPQPMLAVGECEPSQLSAALVAALP
jgi:anti-sigma factor RsiW